MTNYSQRIKPLYSFMNPCKLCPRNCGIDRTRSQNGKCRTGLDVYIASHNLHAGEEPPISGTSGSGTIFFSNCNLSCIFCQNYPISQLGNGKKVTIDELSKIMLELQNNGAHNINLVTPTHVVPQIVEAITLARKSGLTVPIVYNCGGYESVEVLKLLEGIIDIYLPDAKYSSSINSKDCSGISDYWDFNKEALKEMNRQVGLFKMDSYGIGKSGLIVRHMVLPGNLAGSKQVLEFIAKELSPKTYISLMAQYHPAHKATKHEILSRRINETEYNKVVSIASELGLENGWIQDL